MTDVLITGASGMLGRDLMRRFGGAVGTALSRTGAGLTRLDLTDHAATSALIRELRPKVIVHAAAERRPDVSEKDHAATRALNVDATANLGKAAREVGSYVLGISTDYVFDGSRAPYAEEDAPHPLNYYGQTKLAGEEALRASGAEAAILRVGLLYGKVETPGESSVTTLLNQVRPGEPVKLDHWQLRYPTFTEDVAVLCKQLADARMTGTFHWCGNERFTKYEMGLAMAELLGMDGSFLIADAEPPAGAPRPYDCALDCSKAERLGLGRHTAFRTALAAILPGI